VQGFVLASPRVDNPEIQPVCEYEIAMQHPKYAAVITPCCSIENREILLAPLEEIQKVFYSNPYLERDMTRINRMMTPRNSVSAEVWEKMGHEGQVSRFGTDLDSPVYAWLEYFIYDQNDLLGTYDLSVRKVNIKCGYYMISFKNIARVECKAITRENENDSSFKRLEMNVGVRKELRDKLAYYFGRVPVEDQAKLNMCAT